MTKRAKIGVDFVRLLETDVAIIIFKCLDDPADLIRASLVSQYWHNFVVSNELSKQLSVATCPQLSNIVYVYEINTRKEPLSEVECSSILYKEHKVYASLLQVIRKLPSMPVDCVKRAYSASSTNNILHESLRHTCDHSARHDEIAPHWSSEGQKDPNVPEKLLYALKSNLTVITDICIQPFQDVLLRGNPIYSSKSVRFRMGHLKRPAEIESGITWDWKLNEDKYIWTYTSEEFPMSQENKLQHFKLREPVLCIGGFVEVQLLGRVQKKETDGLFYICVSLVKVMGHSVSDKYHATMFSYGKKLSLLKWIVDNEEDFKVFMKGL